MRHILRLLVLVAVVALGAAAIAPATARTDPRPVRIVLTPTYDPATSQHVSWRTPSAYKDQRVRFRPASGGAWRTVRATRKARTSVKYSGTSRPQYTASMRSLRPGTTYTYEIRHAKGASTQRRFTTATRDAKPFSLVTLGDTQIDNGTKVKAVVDRALRDRPAARMVLQVGDVVNKPYSNTEWSGLFRAMGDSRRTRNWAIAIGNHEQCKLVKKCSSNKAEGFRSAFRWPRNGWKNQGQTWYYTDYQGVRVVALDPFGGRLAEQVRFADKALATNPGTWSIVILHNGPFASRPDRTQKDVRTALLPVVERRGVDLVLSGHDHVYARGYHGDPNGTVFAVSNSGPKFYDFSGADWRRHGATVVRSAARTATYQTIDVTPTQLRFRAVVGLKGKGASTSRRVGQVLDSFTITRDGGTKRVVED